MKRKIFLIFSILFIFSISLIGIQQEYLLTGDDKIVCDAILVHAFEFDDPTSIKLTGGTYDEKHNTVFVSLALKNGNGILVSRSFRIYGEDFENMEEIYGINEDESKILRLCNMQGKLNIQKINNIIYRRLRECVGQ